MKWVTLETTISVCGPSGQPIYPTKRGNYWLKYETGSFWHCEEKSVLKHEVLWHRKDRTLSRKSTTSLIHHRTTMARWLTEAAFFFSCANLCFTSIDWCARIRLNVRVSLSEKESSTGRTLLSTWGATSIQWNIKMPRLHLVADVINHYEELIQS